MTEKETQCKRVLQRLKNGGITSYEAYADLGVTQLATRISELENGGVKVLRRREQGVNRYGKKVWFTRYFFGGV